MSLQETEMRRVTYRPVMPQSCLAVAQISNLLYRRIPFGEPTERPGNTGLGEGLKIGTPRYGPSSVAELLRRVDRMESCATIVFAGQD
jgi:hypothetical protein